jgi:hypothetical protein
LYVIAQRFMQYCSTPPLHAAHFATRVDKATDAGKITDREFRNVCADL